MVQICKWSLRYDGGKEPLAFLEQAGELTAVYQVSVNLLLRAMPLCLCDNALAWYRTNNCHWTKWSYFKLDFIALL